jgi:hypothetical protein
MCSRSSKDGLGVSKVPELCLRYACEGFFVLGGIPEVSATWLRCASDRFEVTEV